MRSTPRPPCSIRTIGKQRRELPTGRACGRSILRDLLADVLVDSTNQYRVVYYRASEVTGFSNGLYQTTGNAFATNTVSNPGSAGETNQVRITASHDGDSTVYDFEYVDGAWQLTQGDGMRHERATTATTNDTRTVTKTVWEGEDDPVQVGVQQYETFDWGEGLVAEVTGSGTAAQTNTYAYYDDGTLQESRARRRFLGMVCV